MVVDGLTFVERTYYVLQLWDMLFAARVVGICCDWQRSSCDGVTCMSVALPSYSCHCTLYLPLLKSL